MTRKIIPTFLCLFGAISTSCTPLADIDHVHPLLGCLDRWEIPDFDSKSYQPAHLRGPCFTEMIYTMGQDSCAHHGWAQQQGTDAFKVLLFGCLEVDVNKDGSGSGRILWDVTAPIVKHDQKRWMETRLFGSSPRPNDAADLIIIARGYEAGGQKDMARWLVDQVLAKYPAKEALAKQAAHRFADWHYQVAIDRWMTNADWSRLASDLENLAAKAPQDWAYHSAIQDLRRRIAQVPRDHLDVNPIKQLMKQSLYGPGRIDQWYQLGNWVLFPHSERSYDAKNERFGNLMSVDASALPLWAELIEDNTPCAFLQSITGRDPEPGELRRHPSSTRNLALRFIKDATPWRIEENENAASIRDKCIRTSHLLSGKSSQEKFLTVAELADSGKDRKAAIFGLYDIGYDGSWSEVESQMINDCLSINDYPTILEDYVRLRNSEASDSVRRLEQAIIDGGNQGTVKQKIGPNTWWTTAGGILDKLKAGLGHESLEEMLKKWPEHRGTFSLSNSDGRKPMHHTSPTRLLDASLKEAVRNPAFFCDFLELAMRHRRTPDNLIEISWPGPQTSFATCRQPLNKLLQDQSIFPLATRARGQGRLAETPAQIAAWMMLDSTVDFRNALSFDGYAFLGVEWLDELVTECQKTMDGSSLPDLAGVKHYADMTRFTPPKEDTVTQALKWDAAQFREKWRALPLSQRLALASKPVIPVEGDLEKLRSVVRHARGQPIVKEGDPFTDDALEKMIKWAGTELPNSKGLCGMVRWRSGLAGVDVETDSFADSSVLSHYVFDSFKKIYGSKPNAKHLIIVSARRDNSTRGWTVEAGSPELAKIPAELKQWREKLPGSKLAQDSIWLLGIAKDILK